MKFNSALIVGAGPGLGASLARLFAANDLNVTLAARSTDKLLDLCKETGANAVQCDASNETDVERLFKTMAEQNLLPDLVVYNASGDCLTKAGGKFLLVSEPVVPFFGEDERWDLVVIGSYPSAEALLDLFEQPAYHAAYVHRTAGCEKERVSICLG